MKPPVALNKGEVERQADRLLAELHAAKQGAAPPPAREFSLKAALPPRRLPTRGHRRRLVLDP